MSVISESCSSSTILDTLSLIISKLFITDPSVLKFGVLL